MKKPRKPRTPRSAPSYFELLRDPRWQRRKAEIMERDGWMCIQCGRGERNLQVHHSAYIYGRLPWEYEDASLHTLCDGCHADETAWSKELKAALLTMPPGHMERLVGFVEAMSASSREIAYRMPVKSDEHCQGVASFFGLSDFDVYDGCDEGYTVDTEELDASGIKRSIYLRKTFKSAGKKR